MDKAMEPLDERDSTFERIRRVGTDGGEHWASREIANVLGYADYRNFETVLRKARTACFNSGQAVEDHFVDVNEMVDIGSGARRSITSVHLSRYACYLIVQNADPAKAIVALGQSYFAVQTRRQEIADIATEDERRLVLRREMRHHNAALASAAKDAGVVESRDFAIFQNHGYAGLYGGRTMQDIHRGKRLKKTQHILDHMGSTELAANLFRATQTEEKIRRENIRGKEAANRIHEKVGRKVRQTIEELGGTMPENLPVAESIKKVETRERKGIRESPSED
jgi:DNA-damage-inducible protein D